MELPKRKPNRIPHFDCSTPGAYFVTICTEHRKTTLCSIVGDGFPVPKPPGQIAEDFIRKIPEKYPCVSVDHYVIMPNHIHLLLRISSSYGTGNPPPTLGNIIGWYKYQTTKEIQEKSGRSGSRFFQRSYHDHIIRNEASYLKIWQYIDNNPVLWANDCFFSSDM